MAELILMRHAAALGAADGDADFGRALSGPGRRAAALAAGRLREAGVAVERVLYSPARRTQETAEILARELALEPSLLTSVPQLYGASAQVIRQTVERFHGEAQVLMVIGHNPGISEFGQELKGASSLDHLQTAAFWRLRLDSRRWGTGAADAES